MLRHESTPLALGEILHPIPNLLGRSIRHQQEVHQGVKTGSRTISGDDPCPWRGPLAGGLCLHEANTTATPPEYWMIAKKALAICFLVHYHLLLVEICIDLIYLSN